MVSLMGSLTGGLSRVAGCLLEFAGDDVEYFEQIHRLAGQDVLLIAVMVMVGEVRQIGIVTHIVPAPSQAIG